MPLVPPKTQTEAEKTADVLEDFYDREARKREDADTEALDVANETILLLRARLSTDKEIFRRYARSHRAKQTDDGDKKAAENDREADRIAALLERTNT